MKHLKTYEENNFDINDYLSDNGKKISLPYNVKVTRLPELPEKMEELDCSNSNLTELPKLPKSLLYLDCGYNELSELPELPKGLVRLICFFNDLSELPELPDSLEYLYCENNNLPYTNLDGYWEWYKEEHPDLWAAKQMGLY